jgi:hypothetical protein
MKLINSTLFLLLILLALNGCKDQEPDSSYMPEAIKENKQRLKDAEYLNEYPPQIDTFLKRDINGNYSKDSISNVQILPYHTAKLREERKNNQVISSSIYIDTAEIYVQVDLNFKNSNSDIWLYIFDINGEFIEKHRLPNN